MKAICSVQKLYWLFFFLISQIYPFSPRILKNPSFFKFVYHYLYMKACCYFVLFSWVLCFTEVKVNCVKYTYHDHIRSDFLLFSFVLFHKWVEESVCFYYFSTFLYKLNAGKACSHKIRSNTNFSPPVKNAALFQMQHKQTN